MSVDHHLTRRSFLTRFGKAGLAVAILGAGAAACSDDRTSDSTAGSEATATTAGTTAETTAGTTAPSPSSSVADEVTEVSAADWARVDLGFVSAYVLVRSGEAAVVDTGTSGSVANIEGVLTDLGLDWSSVGHLILTHSHGDHVGSLTEVMTNAAAAAAYAGTADIPSINAPRDLIGVGDGDQVFGLDIIATPGHTPGHISVLDPVGRLLVAGDALNGEAGGVIGPNRQFSANMANANDSARKLAELDFDALVFGHGDPVLTGAGDALRTLIENL